MKYYVGLIFVVFSLQISAQNIVKMSAVKSNDYGVTYNLPKTSISITANYSKKTRKAGEFYQYAERYLNVSNPITEDEVIYKLESIDTYTTGIPDKDRSYLVEFKSGTAGAFVTLTEDGIICAINDEILIDKRQPEKPISQPSAVMPNPKSFLSEEILRAGSSAKQAELIAKQIYRLRESKTNILTGEAENMPPDGNAYKLIMSQIDEQEQALTSMFIGSESMEHGSKSFTIIPDEKNIDKKILFRFSSKLGIVESNDLSGAPVVFSLTNKEPREEAPELTAKEQKALDDKFSKGIIYNIPAKGNLKIEYNNQTILQKDYDIVQFGTQEIISPKQLEYKKDAPIKILFYPDLGSIRQVQ